MGAHKTPGRGGKAFEDTALGGRQLRPGTFDDALSSLRGSVSIGGRGSRRCPRHHSAENPANLSRPGFSTLRVLRERDVHRLSPKLIDHPIGRWGLNAWMRPADAV